MVGEAVVKDVEVRESEVEVRVAAGRLSIDSRARRRRGRSRGVRSHRRRSGSPQRRRVVNYGTRDPFVPAPPRTAL